MSELSVELRHAKRSSKKALDLSKRQISYIPRELFSIVTLEELDLSNNKITTLQPGIAELFRLKVLLLDNNSLAELPEEIMQLPKLTTLGLRGNPLAAQFLPLLSPKFSDNLQDVLSQCFENRSPAKTPGKGKAETPSWLMEDKKERQQKQEEPPAWEPNLFRPQTGTKTTFGRRTNNKPEQKIQAQPERDSVNGVLVLKTSDLQIGQQISMGGFSTIHKGRFFELEVAIKKVFNPNITEELLNEFNNEVSMLAKYRHPNIVLMLGAITTPPQLLLVMEYVKEGTLFDLIHRKKIALSQADKRKIAVQLVGVVAYLHRMGIVHRDIKSHNILIDKGYSIKLCDFGLARHKSQLNSGPMQFSGTPIYMAQELFQKRAYNESVDIFALGTLLYELYSGEIPYHGLDPSDIKERILKDSALPMKLAVRKPVAQMSIYGMMQSIVVALTKQRNDQLLSNWPNLESGDWMWSIKDYKIIHKNHKNINLHRKSKESVLQWTIL